VTCSLRGMRRLIVALTLVAVTSARASAADVVSEFQNRSTAVYAQVGPNTPLGYAGVEAEQMITKTYAVSLGAGQGMGGPQVGAMARLLLGDDRSKFVVGAGASGGRALWREFCLDDSECAQKSGTVAWGNFELGGEHRFRNGFAFRYFGGIGHVIAGSLTCDAANSFHYETSHAHDGYTTLYTGGALGYAF